MKPAAGDIQPPFPGRSGGARRIIRRWPRGVEFGVGREMISVKFIMRA
jgi:hypothetical protein